MKEIIRIALTGHRPPKLAGYNLNVPYYDVLSAKLRALVEDALEHAEHVELHSGMALGADTVWAKVILQLKVDYPGRVTFVADIPDHNQPNAWFAKKDVDFWHTAVAQADVVNTFSEGAKSYPQALQLRNIGMIAPCEYVIAVYDGESTGGTANAIKYAQKNGKTILLIDSEEIRQSVITGAPVTHAVLKPSLTTDAKPDKSFTIRQRS